jgi:uncharacterized membrane protein SpoIIM required for sporulation
VDIDAYIADNVVHWRRLEHLTGRVRLTAEQVDELMALYQRTGAQLSVLRGQAPDPLLLAWLSRVVLTARGRLASAGSSPVLAVRRFFVEGFPLAVYQARRWWITVGAVFVGLSGALMAYIANSPTAQAQLAPPSDARQMLAQNFRNYYSEHPAQDFALHVWTNNALLTGECLAAGVLVIPVLLILADNLLNLGVTGGFMIAYGHGDEFFGLITPHGLLELTAVFVGAGVGLRIGWSWIAPGPGSTRGRSLAAAARSGMLVALGLVCVLGVSGLLEAFVTPSALPTVARIAVGAVAWAAFLTYVYVFGRRAHDLELSADVESIQAAPARSTV